MAVTVQQGSKQFQGAFSELWLVKDDAATLAMPLQVLALSHLSTLQYQM